MITVPPFGSHLVPLVGCVAQTQGRVLELGSGVFSTPVLHAACAGRELLTADSDPAWMQRFQYLEGDNHRFELVRDWSAFARLDEGWDVALVDQSPGHARAPSIERLRQNTRLIVVHDTNEVAHYKFEPLLSSFRYRKDYLELGLAVRTTVVSDHETIPVSVPPPTANHTAVGLSDAPIRIETSGSRWEGRTVPWPRDTGHFFLAGDLTVDVPARDLIVHAVYLDENGGELFYMNLVPGAVRGQYGSFCLAQETAQAVPEQLSGRTHPDWSSVRRVLTRAKASSAAVSVSNLRLLALSKMSSG